MNAAHRLLCASSIVGLAVLLLWAAPAQAGRLVATGHDADDHCSGATPEQCHYFRVATNYVRKGAPDPGKKLLVLECNGGVTNALENAYADVPAKRSVCPSAAPGAFRDLALSTRRFSAILVGSSCDDVDSDGVGDNTLNLTDDEPGGCDEAGGSTPDSDLINDRKGDIRRFFNRGGGIFAMSGDNNGDGDASNGPDRYYNFLPLTAEGVAVNPPFCLTRRGIELGFHDQDCPNPARHNGTQNDINCCETHNSFAEPPSGSALKVAERDSEGFAETLVAEGEIRRGEIVGAGGGELKVTVDPKRTQEDKPTCFDFKVTSDGDRVRGAKIKFGGETAKTNRRGKVTMCDTFGDPGRKRARATKRGFDPDSTSVRVIAAPGFTG